MSNHPEGLDIYVSVGPPTGILHVKDVEGGDSTSHVPISGMQDISTFGIAGRIWDSSYTLDAYMRRPTDQYTFTPACPIPTEYFLPTKTTTPTTASTTTTSEPASAAAATTKEKKKPIRILEIGAGTGYVGIALAKRLDSDCTVILTDLEEVVPLLQKNVNEQRLSHRPPTTSASAATTIATASETGPPAVKEPSCAWIEVEPLEWGNTSHALAILDHPTPIDYIVASDLVYFPELYPSLLQTLKEITRVGETKILFGYKERAIWKESPFWEEFGRFFEMEAVRIERHPVKKEGEVGGEEEEEEEEGGVKLFGCEGEDRLYVFVATKRPEDQILKGADDTLATLMMMQIGL
ncbi:hypothetical protein EC957_000460 [Mortierella hygrophila]|uniref:Uncharacterized protein n=1 Tax=Mortierella hygrophila TaxID=979708 RepID=A0A9P6F7R1_9FUNG|nr:hypothetical protein EC957_000460 [Mortierella hygrophila]